LFSIFKSSPFHDPELGELVRSRGLWRGSLTIEAGVTAPLTLSGTRTDPNAQALTAAREVAQAFPSWRPAIERALFEHYEPYAEAVTAGELPPPSEALPRIAAPGDVWSHVSLVFVSVTPLSGLLTTELGYTTAWDEEHTLGTRFQSGSSSNSVAVFCLREITQTSIRTHIGASREAAILAIPAMCPLLQSAVWVNRVEAIRVEAEFQRLVRERNLYAAAL
jgi:Domain of unknown function (DUF6985)